jgi:hypothetical protein
MEQIFVFSLVLLTSVAAYIAGVTGFDLAPGRLPTALVKGLELVGLIVVFFVVNLGLGAMGVALARTVTPTFLSFYLLNDLSLLVLSALQGLLFELWRDLP